MSELKEFVEMLDKVISFPETDSATGLVKSLYLLSIQNRIRIIELEERIKDA